MFWVYDLAQHMRLVLRSTLQYRACGVNKLVSSPLPHPLQGPSVSTIYMNFTFYLGTSYLDWYVHMRMFILSGNVNLGNDLQLLIRLVLNMANLLQRVP